MRKLTDAELLELELLMDRRGLRAILQSLAHISREKQAHVEDNWQDRSIASAWNRTAKFLEASTENGAVLDCPLN